MIKLTTHKLCGVILACVWCGILCARALHADDRALFSHAQKLYHQKQYNEALDAYNSMEKKDAATWFNMGNCAYLLAQYGNARLFWRRAERLGTSWQLLNESAQHLRMLDAQEDTDNPESWIAFMHRVMKLVPVLPLQIGFILLWILLFLALAGIGRFRAMRGIFSLGVMVLAIMVIIRYTATSREQGVVIEKEAILFAGPDDSFHAIATLNNAQEVCINDIKDHWCKVVCERNVGWVKRESIAIV